MTRKYFILTIKELQSGMIRRLVSNDSRFKSSPTGNLHPKSFSTIEGAGSAISDIPINSAKKTTKCAVPDKDGADGSNNTGAEEEEDEMEEMFVQGPAGIEWNGPTRGGKRPEPTRYGDWERKGRASDF
jgi:hypothetical protein